MSSGPVSVDACFSIVYEELSESAPVSAQAVAAGLAPSNSLVLQQLSRILQSKTFIHSDKLSRFLRFVVEHVIDGNPRCLKEYLIGVEVYDRNALYDPSQDSIVRTEARRLRNKLKEYYGAEGSEDPVFVYLRPGSYIPAFQFREDLIGIQDPAPPFQRKNPSSIATIILPFRDISQNQVSSAFARGIPDELAYALMLIDGCTVISSSSIAYRGVLEHGPAAMMNKAGVQIAFEGTVRAEGSHLRVIARIINAAGSQLWVKRIDTEIGSQTSFAVEEEIAHALSRGFENVLASILDTPNAS